MPKRIVDLGSGKALLDIASYGRSAVRTLSPVQRQKITLTVGHAPEVMVKVSGGARSLGGVAAHLAYIGREGSLGVETDQGTHLAGRGFEKWFIPDWDLDLRAHRMQDARSIRGTRRPAKLVHNIIFSMPPGTPPSKVLAAVRSFAVNEFALQHRYALVMHTNESHPHVHLVVKAVSEQGERLNVRKSTLRSWRDQFAARLREQGVPANATERAVRGQIRMPRTDGLYRTAKRNVSMREWTDTEDLANESPAVLARRRKAREKLQRTRSQVVGGWDAVADLLREMGDHRLAQLVHEFLAEMPRAQTDQLHLMKKALGRQSYRDAHLREMTR